MADLMRALRNAHNAGDEAAARRIAAMIRAQQSTEQQPIEQPAPPKQYQSESEIPLMDEVGLPFAPKQVQGEQAYAASDPRSKVLDYVVGAGDAALTLGTGATTGMLGHLGGTAYQMANEMERGNFGTPEAANRIESAAMKGADALTFSPKTQVGQNIVDTVADASTALLMPELQIGATRPFGTKKVIKQGIVAKEIKKNARTLSNINKTIANGKLVKNKSFKVAKSLQGNTDAAKHTAILFDGMNNFTKKRVGKILDKIQNGRERGDLALMEDRPVGVIGEGLAWRAKRLDKIRRSANKKLDKVLNTELKGKLVDFSGSLNEFVQTLQEKGVKLGVDENGKIRVNLESARLRLGDVLPAKDLERILGQIKSGKLDAKVAHEMKQHLREFVDYGETQIGGVKQSKAVSDAIKKLSTGINDQLVATSKRYGKANDEWASTADALSATSKHLKGIDLNSNLAKQKLGALSKRIGSNLVSREQIIAMIDEMEAALNKNGIHPNDNIAAQVLALSKIEDIFGVETLQAPYSHTASVAKGLKAAASPKSAVVETGLSLLQKMTDKDFNSKVAALRKLLKETK